MNNMNIRVEISRCPQPWLKLVTATHPVYHLDGEFIPLRRISAKYQVTEITATGVYWGPRIGKGQVVAGGKRIDSGVFRVDETGAVTEMTMDEARDVIGSKINQPKTNADGTPAAASATLQHNDNMTQSIEDCDDYTCPACGGTYTGDDCPDCAGE